MMGAATSRHSSVNSDEKWVLLGRGAEVRSAVWGVAARRQETAAPVAIQEAAATTTATVTIEAVAKCRA